MNDNWIDTYQKQTKRRYIKGNKTTVVHARIKQSELDELYKVVTSQKFADVFRTMMREFLASKGVNLPPE